MVTGLKFRIAMAFVLLLATAMLLQSIALLMAGAAQAVKREVAEVRNSALALARQELSALENQKGSSRGVATPLPADSGGSLQFSCTRFIYLNGPIIEGQGCRFPEEISALSDATIKEKESRVAFAGTTWALMFIRSEAVLLSLPLIASDGRLLGALTVERSLLPVYDQYEDLGRIALAYGLMNIIILSIAGYFRMSRALLKPLEKLVLLADRVRPNGIALFPVGNERGEFRKLTVTLRGLFERIESDNEKLRRSVTDLERANRELLDNKKLIVRSEKLASIGRLTAGMAHEIGNPLAIIGGYVDLLGRGDITEEEKQTFSHNAGLELARIDSLIQQFLDYAKPKGLARENIGVHKLIEDVARFIMVDQSSKKCSVLLQFEAVNDSILSDYQLLRQVILNCLLNSLDAMEDIPEQAKRITISTHISNDGDAPQNTLFITLEDEGPGIPEEQIDNIFDPFFTTKEPGKGTGLGLFVSHTVMEQLGGDITISNRPDRGVKVVIGIHQQGEAQ